MKTLAEIEKIKEELAQSQVNEHCGKSDVVCITTTNRDFKSGFDACLALMLEREKVARDCISFYAERNNWRSPNYDSETKSEIITSDLGCKSFNGENNFADFAIPSGGRRAREALEKLK